MAHRKFLSSCNIIMKTLHKIPSLQFAYYRINTNSEFVFQIVLLFYSLFIKTFFANQDVIPVVLDRGS